MKRTWIQRIGYDLSAFVCLTIARVFFRTRILGRENSRIKGGVLVCSNHQSYLDPIIVGMGCRRRLSFLARDSLFRSRIFGALIRFYEAIPIQRDGMGIGGLKETLRQLKHGRAVVIFPEGTRTMDGSLLDLKPGFCALVRRGKVPILPVAIHGAYDAWPRNKKFPRLAKITVCFGEPILPDVIKSLTDEQLVALVAERIAQSFARARGSA